MLCSQKNETHNFSYRKTKQAVLDNSVPVFPTIKIVGFVIYASNLQKFYSCVTSIIYTANFIFP